jgi:hypothetical protein
MRLFAYLEGYDNAGVAATMGTTLDAFAESHRASGIKFVNDRDSPSPQLRAGDLPRWDLGLNFPAAVLNQPTFDHLLRLLQNLASSTGREFVLGVESSSAVAEDVAYVPADAPIEAKRKLQQYIESVLPE